MTDDNRRIIDGFHKIYYEGLPGNGEIFAQTHWMGYPCLKCPLDMWIYQEIIHQVQPDLILETGTNAGGSALFMAHMLDIIGNGEVISFDISDDFERPAHPRIRYVKGSSDDSTLLREVLKGRGEEKRMVVLDSDHSQVHVSKELELFAPLVTVGSYLIVEDTNVNGHPAYESFGPGPYEAVENFLNVNRDFEVDTTREKFLMTFNPNGYLKRIR